MRQPSECGCGGSGVILVEGPCDAAPVEAPCECVAPAAVQRTIQLERLAQHLTAVAMPNRCELTNDAGNGRCSNVSVAVQWEHGFADFVCEEHAAGAAKRGALVVHARRPAHPSRREGYRLHNEFK